MVLRKMSSPKEQIESSTAYRSLSSFTQEQSNDFDTIKALTSSIASSTPSATISTYLETLWNSLLLIACQTDYASSPTHQKLATILQRLQSYNFPDSPPEYNDERFSWSQLPDLNIYIRDWYNFSPPFPSSSTSSSPLKGLAFGEKEWINLNAFLATLTKTSLKVKTLGVDGKPTDYSLYAIWSLRCLEVGPDEITKVDPVDVKTAAVWVMIARNELYALCKEEKQYDGNLARGGDAYRDKGWKGFNIDRWAVWERAFKEILENLELRGDKDCELRKFSEQAGESIRLAMGNSS